jgi:colanic acid/amylovoran biosynthesis protein
MLQVTVQRLKEQWPESELFVITLDPVQLERVCPGVRPVSYELVRELVRGSIVPTRVSRCIPRMKRAIERWEEWVRRNAPNSYFRLKCLRSQVGRWVLGGSAPESLLKDVDILVLSGMGGFTDVFEKHAIHMLRLMQMVLRMKKAVLAFGQGIGPVTPGSLLWIECKRTFPYVDSICLREGLYGPELMHEWGVPPSKVSVTGDDALEIAIRSDPRGCAEAKVGVNLRIAQHSGITTEQAKKIGDDIACAILATGCQPIPIPIACYKGAEDERMAAEALGLTLGTLGDNPIDPGTLVERIAGVKVMVTCSYHAGVFAAAQGIPVIGLAANGYYRYKLFGLSRQFPGGCVVLDPTERRFRRNLTWAIDHALKAGVMVSEWLRELARVQVDEGRRKYAEAAQAVVARRWQG